MATIKAPYIHPASGFKTAFDLDLLSRGQVMLLSTFQCSHFRQISRVKVMKFTNMPLNCYQYLFCLTICMSFVASCEQNRVNFI